jgi:hypothetical protein
MWLRHPEDFDLKEAWKSQQRETNKVIRNANEDSYQDLFDELDLRKDPGGPYRILKSMEAPSGNPRDAAIRHASGVAVSAKDKANLAISHYAAISRLNRNKAEDKEIRATARPLANCPEFCDYCSPFNIQKLKMALRNQKGKAAGNDDIRP